MRGGVAIWAGWTLVAFASAQPAPSLSPSPSPTPGPSKGLGRPQAMILLREDRFGSQIVTITMLETAYPEDLLREQVMRLGGILGEQPRGLQVFRYGINDNLNSSFTKATFGVDRLVGPDGDVQILSVAQALVGAPEPFTVRGFGIVLERFTPGKKTIRNAETSAYRIVGQASGSNLEYRVELKTQDPNQFRLPNVTQKPGAVVDGKGSIDWGLWIPIGAAAAAAGVLVYAGLTWPRARARR